jgi:hypothetical protein
LILSLFDSANTGWTRVTLNILLSFTIIRLARPNVQSFLENHGWIALVVVTAGLLEIMPVAVNLVDYGSEGWLWSLLGLLQGMAVDAKSARAPGVRKLDQMCLAACLTAAVL